MVIIIIGTIYFCLLCIIDTLFVYWLSIYSLHLKQLKECNRQRLILNREILKKSNEYDILSQQQNEEKEQMELDIDESIETKYDEEEPIDINQLSLKISEMQRAHSHLNDVIDFLKQHDFTQILVVKLNKLIWIALIIVLITTTLVFYIFYLKMTYKEYQYVLSM